MLSITQSMAMNGLNGYLVSVQVDVANGLPYFEIVGLPDTIVKESKERVRIGIKNSGYDFFSKRIIINLAPANTKKLGSIFDLAIAIGILTSLGIIKECELNNYVLVGELSLDGKIRKIENALAICIEMNRKGIKNIILPKDNEKEVSIVKGINIYAVTTLREVVEHFNEEKLIDKSSVNSYSDYFKQEEYEIDFSDVYGQEKVKRVLEIAAAGSHNVLMIGSPGSGKTMLAERFQTILPPLSFKEYLEVAKIYNLYSDNLNSEIKRPFRTPHYTITERALIGGGDIPKPGEVTLANNGILFLDEFAEYKAHTLDVLRTPIEDKKITISRVNSKVEFPANFILIAAMNPCPCGYYGSTVRECTCSENSRRRYLHKISGPLLDRFDLIIYVNLLPYKKLNTYNMKKSSKNIRERVIAVRDIQNKRYEKLNINNNSELSNSLIREFCKLDEKSKVLLEKFYMNKNITTRRYNKILKVSRTIADLDSEGNIKYKHIAEALQYSEKGVRL